MSDFSDRPFAAGSVFGLRAFRPTETNLLVGVRHNAWTQGENVATCQRSIFDLDLSGYIAPPDHRAAIKGCTCGFYAYFDGSNSYASLWGRCISAVVEGYGLVTIGNRGFRSEKARIVGLTVTFPVPDLDLSENYPDIPIYITEADLLAAHPISKPEDFGITPDPNPPQQRTYANGGVVFGPLNFAGIFQSVKSSTAQAAADMKKLSDMLDREYGNRDKTEDGPDDNPVTRVRKQAELAAERRQKNLRGQGINRRQRNLR